MGKKTRTKTRAQVVHSSGDAYSTRRTSRHRHTRHSQINRPRRHSHADTETVAGTKQRVAARQKRTHAQTDRRRDTHACDAGMDRLRTWPWRDAWLAPTSSLSLSLSQFVFWRCPTHFYHPLCPFDFQRSDFSPPGVCCVDLPLSCPRTCGVPVRASASQAWCASLVLLVGFWRRADEPTVCATSDAPAMSPLPLPLFHTLSPLPLLPRLGPAHFLAPSLTVTSQHGRVTPRPPCWCCRRRAPRPHGQGLKRTCSGSPRARPDAPPDHPDAYVACFGPGLVACSAAFA